MKLNNLNFQIEITEDPTYRLFSVDNRPYHFIYTMEEYDRNSHYNTFALHVENINSSQSFDLAIVGGFYSSSTDNCAVLDDCTITVFMQNTVIVLDLISFSLTHKNRVFNFGTGFAIYPFHDCYLIHGELEIILINKKTEIVWTFSGQDIFVLPYKKDGHQTFQIDGEHIIVYDWNDTKYIIDKNGKPVKN